MSDFNKLRCSDLSNTGFDVDTAAEETWQALLSAGCFIEGNFVFASGINATLKVDAELLYSHPRHLETVLGHFAAFPCIQDAEVLMYVPDGMRQFMTTLGNELGKPVAHTKRRPGSSSKYDFVFTTKADENLAESAELIVIGEDIVSTLGSVAATRSLLKPTQTVHSLAMLQRGVVNPDYQKGLVDHYLVKRHIPTDKDEFNRQISPDTNAG